MSARSPALTDLAAWPRAACRIAPVEMPAKMPSASSSSRVRRTASRGPTEKRASIRDASYSSGRSPRRGCAGRRRARRTAARRRRRDLGLVLAEEAADAHQRAGGAEPGHEVGDLGQVREDLGAGALVVRERVGGVAVLVEHHPVGVLLGDLLGDPDGLVGAAGGRRGDDLGAPHPQQLATLLGGVLRHHADQPVALELGGHRQRDAGVARRGLEDRAARAERARPSPPPRPSSAPHGP